MKTYRLTFKADAHKEWKKLGASIRAQFGKKLKERLRNPRVQSSKLRDLPDCYKIKLASAGYRLVYQVYDDRVVVVVIAIGKRERGGVYKVAALRVN